MSPRSDPELTLLLAHTRWVEELAHSLVRDPHAAQDLAQSTLLVALQHERAPPTHWRAWMAQVMRNLLRERSRRDAQRVGVEARGAQEEALPDAVDLLERAECERRVVAAVLALDEPHRGTLLLRYFEQLSPGQIARRSKLPLATITSRITRAHARLRERLQREDPRGQGLLALIPILARPTPRALSAPMLLAMKTSLKIAVAVLFAGVLTWTLWPKGDAQPGDSLAAADSAASSSLAAAPAEALPEPPTATKDQRATLVAQPSAAASTPAAPTTPASGRIFGRVFRPDGIPAAKRRVRMLHMTKGPEKYAVCDEEGRFDEPDLAAGPWALSTWPGKEELAALGKAEEKTIDGFIYMSQRTVDLEQGMQVEVNLGVPPQNGVATRGRILENGQAVEASMTWLPDGSDSMDRQQLAVASIQKGYELVLTEPGQFVVVLIHDSTRIEYSVAVPSGKQFVRDFELPTGLIAGTVVDAAGAPLADVRVALTPRAAHRPRHPSADITYTRTTTADGRFEFRNLPAARFALAAHPSQSAKSASPWAAITPRALELGPAEQLDALHIELAEGTMLAGSVSELSAPASYAHVFLFDAQGEALNPLSSCDTNKQGEFQTMALAAGRYRMVAARGLNWSAPHSFEMPRPPEDAAIELKLLPCALLNVDIAGRGDAWIDVRDGENGCFAALFDKHVFNRVVNRDWSSSVFTYRLPAGEYRVKVRGAGGVVAEQAVELRSGETVNANLSR